MSEPLLRFRYNKVATTLLYILTKYDLTSLKSRVPSLGMTLREPAKFLTILKRGFLHFSHSSYLWGIYCFLGRGSNIYCWQMQMWCSTWSALGIPMASLTSHMDLELIGWKWVSPIRLVLFLTALWMVLFPYHLIQRVQMMIASIPSIFGLHQWKQARSSCWPFLGKRHKHCGVLT